MRRNRFNLTAQEISEFSALRPEPARIWAFWHNAAEGRGLDPATILCDENFPHTFTALPINHDKPWCWPWTLKLNRKPSTV